MVKLIFQGNVGGGGRVSGSLVTENHVPLFMGNNLFYSRLSNNEVEFY